MSAPVEFAKEQLTSAGYLVATSDSADRQYLKFENDTILGFVLDYGDAAELISTWQATSRSVLSNSQFALRRAEAKSWNTYLVFLAQAPADYGQNTALAAVEEDLVGTRKIARAGILTPENARDALLPLLAIQSAPRLDPVDMGAEIRLRTSELPAALVDAFVGEAPEATLLHLLEANQ